MSWHAMAEYWFYQVGTKLPLFNQSNGLVVPMIAGNVAGGKETTQVARCEETSAALRSEMVSAALGKWRSAWEAN
jgi:hypothetical protein